MLLILFNHLQFLFIGRDNLLQPMFEQWLSVNGLRFIVLLELQGLSISLIIHIFFFEGIELFDILIPLYFILGLDFYDFLLQFLRTFLFSFD
jgi:hypothetical protein